MTVMTICLRMLLSAIAGGLVGFERELRGPSAGFRTHMLVCVGSALFMATSILVASNYGHLGAVDPSRIAAGVVTGVGFLGAGAVIRSKSSVHGLTTAASIWAVSAIGLSLGAGLYMVGIITSVIVLLVLFLSRIKGWIDSRDGEEHSTNDSEEL